jgi:hypothetical protein
MATSIHLIHPSSIEKNIDPLNTAAANFLQDIQEKLDELLSSHFNSTIPQNNQSTNPAMSFCQKFEPSNSVVVLCQSQIVSNIEEDLKRDFESRRFEK